MYCFFIFLSSYRLDFSNTDRKRFIFLRLFSQIGKRLNNTHFIQLQLLFFRPTYSNLNKYTMRIQIIE